MSDPTLAPALDDDVRTFAATRCGDAGGARLYLALAAAAPAGAWIAKDGEEPVGIAFAHAYDGAAQLAECYVHPSQRRRGFGRALAQAAFGESVRRFAVFEAGDPTGAAFAVRCGLALRETLLRLTGEIPKEDVLLELASRAGRRFRVAAIDPAAHARWLDTLDRETLGLARLDDHERFAASATGSAFFLDEEFVGYAYAWADGRIGPFASVSPTYAPSMLAHSLAALQLRHSASWCSMLTPGRNLRLVQAALEVGLKVERSYTLAGDLADADFSRYSAAHTLLL